MSKRDSTNVDDFKYNIPHDSKQNFEENEGEVHMTYEDDEFSWDDASYESDEENTQDRKESFLSKKKSFKKNSFKNSGSGRP